MQSQKVSNCYYIIIHFGLSKIRDRVIFISLFTVFYFCINTHHFENPRIV